MVLPGSMMKLELDWFRGPLVYGTPTIEPAKIGELKTKFHGKPVYDEVLIFRVPVHVKADAEYQKFPIKGHVELTMHDAQTGKSLGEFATAVSGTAHIGRPLPNAAIARPTKTGGSGGPGSTGAAKTATGAALTGPTPQASGHGGNPRGNTSPGKDGTPDGLAPAKDAYEELGSMGTVLWVAGALVVLLIALLVLRRR